MIQSPKVETLSVLDIHVYVRYDKYDNLLNHINEDFIIMNSLDFFSITTIGERGQIVIPKDARNALGLSAGNRLVVLPSRRGNGILLMKEENIKELAQKMSEKADHIIQKTKKLKEKLDKVDLDK